MCFFCGRFAIVDEFHKFCSEQCLHCWVNAKLRNISIDEVAEIVRKVMTTTVPKSKGTSA